MNAIFFYIFVFFLGYYGSNVLNMLTVRPWITNRYIAALIPVYVFATAHAYMISTKPLPPGQNVTIESALLEFVVLPVIVVTMGSIYFMWNNKGNQESDDMETTRSAHADNKTADNISTQTEVQPETTTATTDKNEIKK